MPRGKLGCSEIEAAFSTESESDLERNEWKTEWKSGRKQNLPLAILSLRKSKFLDFQSLDLTKVHSLTHLDLSGIDDNDNEDDAISKEISAPLWKEEVLNTWQLTLQSILTVCLGCDTPHVRD